MSASEKKILIHLVLLCLVIATVNAKALVKRDGEQTDYFEDLLNRLMNLVNVPIVGELMRPYITNIYNTAEGIDEWSEGSVSSLVNSIFPCNLNGSAITCSGTLDRNSLRALIMKILSLLPLGGSVLPILELVRGMAV